jgi:cell division protease FtsH
MLRENRHKLDAVVALPLVHESLDEPQIYSAAGVSRSAAASASAELPR